MLSNLCNPEKLKGKIETHFLGEADSPTCTYRGTKYKHARSIKAKMCVRNDKGSYLESQNLCNYVYYYFLLDTEET